MFSLNGDDRFIEVLGIAQLALPFFQFAGIGGGKLQTPSPDRFVGHENAAFSQQFFHFAETETKSMVEPDGVTDNVSRKTMTLVANRWNGHTE